MHSLRTKITALTVAAVLASLIAAAIAGFFTVGQEVQTSSTEKMHLLSEVERLSLNSYLYDIEQAVEITSQIATSSLDSMTLVECGAKDAPERRSADQTARLDAHLEAHTATVREAFGSVANHTSGVMAYYYCLSPEISKTQFGFFFSREGKVGFEERTPIDVSELDPSDTEHDDWYFSTVNRGVPQWVGPYKDRYADDELVVSYLTPIYCSGVFMGVMGIDIPFETMTDQIGSLKVYETGYACLLDAQGNLLYHPKYGTDNIPESASQAFDPAIFRKIDSADEEITYTKDGETWQMSYSTLSNGMKLVVTAPEREIASSWNRLISIVPLIGAVILTIFTVLVLLATRAITKPLQQLTEGARRLSKGNYEIELDYHGRDEVGELTDAFRSLQEHLQVYTSNLSSSSFSDGLTGVKNREAFEMYAAQVNDAVRINPEDESARFALTVVDCLDAQQIERDFGSKWADTSIQTTCKLLCQIYSEASVFRVDVRRFVVFLQGRNYANRDELFCDFDIRADEINAEATEPWLQVHVAKGMATYKPGTDDGVTSVLERATQRTEKA